MAAGSAAMNVKLGRNFAVIGAVITYLLRFDGCYSNARLLPGSHVHVGTCAHYGE